MICDKIKPPAKIRAPITGNITFTPLNIIKIKLTTPIPKIMYAHFINFIVNLFPPKL
jgi:hypothetical protein